MLSVNHLGRLLECGEYQECLAAARAMLEDEDQPTEALARIQAAVCRCCLELTDYFAAVEAGEAAAQLAAEAEIADLLGQVLIDLGTAKSCIRRYDEALDCFGQFLDGLPDYLSARCLEGIGLQRMSDTLWRVGRGPEAIAGFEKASRWYEHYGDEQNALACTRALIHIRVARMELTESAALLAVCGRYAGAHPEDKEFLTEFLLDLALVHMAAGKHAESAQMAFQALEAAGDRAAHQSRAQLLLAQNALAQERPLEAVSFAMAARVSAIDGKLYDLEFEASEILFRLLREKGERLLRQLESELAEAHVDLFHYISEQAISRMLDSN